MAETVEQIRASCADSTMRQTKHRDRIGTLLAEIDRLEAQSECKWTDHELWKQGDRYTRRVQQAEAVCEAVTRWRKGDNPVMHCSMMIDAHDAYLAGKKEKDDGEEGEAKT